MPLDQPSQDTDPRLEAVETLLTYLYTTDSDTRVNLSAQMPVEVLEDAQRALDVLTAADNASSPSGEVVVLYVCDRCGPLSVAVSDAPKPWSHCQSREGEPGYNKARPVHYIPAPDPKASENGPLVPLGDVVEALRANVDERRMGYHRAASWNSAADFLERRFGG
jgi:hypothetical protein